MAYLPRLPDNAAFQPRSQTAALMAANALTEDQLLQLSDNGGGGAAMGEGSGSQQASSSQQPTSYLEETSSQWGEDDAEGSDDWAYLNFTDEQSGGGGRSSSLDPIAHLPEPRQNAATSQPSGSTSKTGMGARAYGSGGDEGEEEDSLGATISPTPELALTQQSTEGDETARGDHRTGLHATVAATDGEDGDEDDQDADGDEDEDGDGEDEDEDAEEDGDDDDDDDDDDTPLALQVSAISSLQTPTPELAQQERIPDRQAATASRHALRHPETVKVAGELDGDEVEDDAIAQEEEEEDVEAGDDIDADADGDEDEDEDDDDDGLEIIDEDEELDFERDSDDPFSHEVASLYDAVPILRSHFRITEKLGEGTFSTVYKAEPAVRASRGPMKGSLHRGGSGVGSGLNARSLTGGHTFVALKRIYVSSSPVRILNELDILEELRDREHISHLINIFRENDQIIAVMSYSEHADFRDFYRILPMSDIRCYFRVLFSALASVHECNIIHRDVKPANFLYNPLTGHGTLCDFGLAERFDPADWKGKCHHLCPDADFPHGQASLNKAVPSTVYGLMKGTAGRHVAGSSSAGGEGGKGASAGGGGGEEQYAERVGYLKEDTRQAIRANRAGTRGFRAPEVLLKCQDQTVALDIWSAGVILLCMLSKRFPLFNADDDIVAFLELAVLFGRHKMEQCAAFHNRTFKTDIPEITEHGWSLQNFVKRMNPDPFEEFAAFDRLNADRENGGGTPGPGAGASPASVLGKRPLGEAAAPSQRSLAVQTSETSQNPYTAHLSKSGRGVNASFAATGAAAAAASTMDPQRRRKLEQKRQDWLAALDLAKICLNPINTKRWSAARILREHKFFQQGRDAPFAEEMGQEAEQELRRSGVYGGRGEERGGLTPLAKKARRVLL